MVSNTRAFEIEWLEAMKQLETFKKFEATIGTMLAPPRERVKTRSSRQRHPKRTERTWYYRQNLYAALCNQIVTKTDGTKFTLSFRHAGGIMADQSRRGETYLDYYWPCRKQQHEAAIVMGRRKGEVGHGVVTELIRRDLESLGFSLSPNNA